jgi:molecular chaperone Hsp33
MSDPINFSQDIVQPFQLESSRLRGRLVRLGSTLDVILQQHAYPPAVGKLLAETTVLAAALASVLKYEGVFTLQVKSDGPVRMLVADVTSGGGVRAYAQHQDISDLPEGTPLLGKGYLAFTVDQKQNDDRYQGIVELKGDNLSDAAQHYFHQSEQLPTGLMADVKQDDHGRWHGGCLMLQLMPREGGVGGSVSNDNLPPPEMTSPSEDWDRAMILLNTCTTAELTNPFLTPDALLFRLFHEEGVRVYEPTGYRHECRCSTERVESMLKSLPRDEVEELAVDGLVSVTCEFCNRSYNFPKEKRDLLFSEVTATPQ